MRATTRSKPNITELGNIEKQCVPVSGSVSNKCVGAVCVVVKRPVVGTNASSRFSNKKHRSLRFYHTMRLCE